MFQKTDQVARYAGRDDGTFPHAFYALAQDEGKDDGRRDQGNIEVHFELSEFLVTVAGGVFHESFGTHHGHVGFYFENNTDGLHEAADE